MKNEIEPVLMNEDYLKDKIYIIRGQKVMLDSDLAKIYGYTTKSFNRQVQRNIEKFDENFMFQLNEKEALSCSRCQIGTLNSSGNKRGYNIKYLPFAFTVNV